MTQACCFGILNVDKPKGFTSHDVVAKLRKILNTKKIGHTGTLDPMATGVLPVCIGKATKIIQYLDSSKAYRAFIKLGVITDTYDLEGKIISSTPVEFDLEKIKAELEFFKGEIEQRPPMYSAIHYNGKRLYEYARSNIEIEDIPTRKVVINSINLVEVLDRDTDNPVVVVDIDCSGGTYIRSIAYDLGQKLGYGACLSGLIRTKSDKFTIDKSNTIEDIEKIAKEGRINEIILNPANIINLKSISINDNQLDKIIKGQCISVEEAFDEGEKVQLIYQDKLAGIAQSKNNMIWPVNVLI